MRFSSRDDGAGSWADRALWAVGLILLAAGPISPAAAGGLDIFYAQGRANPTQQFPGLDVFAGQPSSAYAPAAPARPAMQTPGEWPGFDIYLRPLTVVAVNTHVQTCQQGTWRFADGAQVSGVAWLQPDGTWRFVRGERSYIYVHQRPSSFSSNTATLTGQCHTCCEPAA